MKRDGRWLLKLYSERMTEEESRMFFQSEVYSVRYKRVMVAIGVGVTKG